MGKTRLSALAFCWSSDIKSTCIPQKVLQNGRGQECLCSVKGFAMQDGRLAQYEMKIHMLLTWLENGKNSIEREREREREREGGGGGGRRRERERKHSNWKCPKKCFTLKVNLYYCGQWKSERQTEAIKHNSAVFHLHTFNRKFAIMHLNKTTKIQVVCDTASNSNTKKF